MSTGSWHTTPELVGEITTIAVQMVSERLDFNWVLNVVRMAKRDPEVFDLMKLWSETRSPEARAAVRADIEKALGQPVQPALAA